MDGKNGRRLKLEKVGPKRYNGERFLVKSLTTKGENVDMPFFYYCGIRAGYINNVFRLTCTGLTPFDSSLDSILTI